MGAGVGITGLEMADLVREVCYDVGTGPLTPGGAMIGFRAFADAAGARGAIGLGSIATQAADSVAISGGSIGGPTSLGISRLGLGGAASVAVQADAGQSAIVTFATSATRWAIGKGGGAEGGSDSGSDFAILSYSDAGAIKATPLSISRASGVVTLAAGLTSSGTVTRQGTAPVSFIADRTSSGANSVMEFRTTAGSVFVGNRDGASLAVAASSNLSNAPWLTVASGGLTTSAVTTANAQVTGGSVTGLSTVGVSQGAAAAAITIDSNAGQFAGLSLRTGTSLRWTLRKSNAAESGSATGSDFVLHRHDDSGTVAGAALQISRATGMSQFDGIVAPLTDNARTLGTAGQRWSVVYAATGAINTSDARAKRDIGAVDDALIDAWGDVGWRVFRFADAWQAKGEAARWHVGLIAQEVRETIDARLGEGAAVRLGLLCHDEWDAEADGDGGVVRPAGDRWGLRYEEIFALEAAWQRRRIDRIEALLEAGDAG